jgi:UDP-N-acetyl-L-fucosamine synthase
MRSSTPAGPTRSVSQSEDLGVLKVMTVLGTRPEIIRLSRIIDLLDRTVDHVLVHTGQNYDDQLSKVFFDDLELRPPDCYLGIDCSSLGTFLGQTIIAVENLLAKHRPDAMLVLGDTNSSIAALMARRMKITVYHMEAGNRCFDENVPEEVNRRVIDHVADFNLVYTEHARRNLLAEGLHPRRIYLTGSPLREVLDHYRERIDDSDILERLTLDASGYFLVSMHREENVDYEANLRRLVYCLELLASEYGLPVIVSTHPRTLRRLTSLGLFDSASKVRFLDPFGYLDYNHLQARAFCVLSDSGTISEESAMLSFPAVTIRNATERPEAMDTGAMIIAGIDPDAITRAVRVVRAQRDAGQLPEVPEDYRITNCSQRVVNLLVGTAGLAKLWSNLTPPEPFWEKA